MKRFVVALAAAATLAAGEPGRWTDPKAGFSCAVPEGWVFQELKDGTAIFHEKDKKPPAFLNVKKVPKKGAPKTLEAYAKQALTDLTVPAKDLKAGTVGKLKAFRASGPVGVSDGKLLDLILFLDDEKGASYFTVMLTCLPDDQKAYEPVLESFAKGLKF